MESTELDGLAESVTEESAEESPVMRGRPLERARKGLKKYESMVKKLMEKVNNKMTNPMVVKSLKLSFPYEAGQGDAQGGREMESQVPPMFLAGLISTASKVKRNERTLADTRLKMEVISQCGSDGLDDYKPSRTNMATIKLEGQLDVVEYSRITVPGSVQLGHLAVGYLEMVKARNSARDHLMAWHDKQALQENLKELITGSNLKRKEYGTVMSSEANENGVELLSETSWKAALQKFFDETMRTPSSVMAYLANPCVRTVLQVRLVWCLVGIKRREHEATIETRPIEKQLELMGALRVLILRDDSAIAWTKRKDALCFVNFAVDRIPTPVLEGCVKKIRQRLMKREEVLLRALLELYQDMPLQIAAKELNDMDSYRRLEEVRRCSNKELTVTRELLEVIRSLKEYATLGKRKSFQYVLGVPGMAYNPFVYEEARDAYFDYEQAVILNFWVERVREMGAVTSEQLQLGVILEGGTSD